MAGVKNKHNVRFDSGGEPQREVRFDIGRNSINNVRVTQQGFLSIPATLTRTGVLTYTRADGSKVRELRHPDDVYAPESLATLEAAPVTDDHHGLIGPDNVSQYSIGIVNNAAQSDNGLVSGRLTVQRRDAIEAVQAKRLREISPGYTCAIDPTPGEWNGERYDQRQTNIIYNHVALGPANWGRSGPEVALRLDGAVSGVEDLPKPKPYVRQTMKIRVTLDGVTYEVDVAEELAPTFEASLKRMGQERADAKDAAAKAEGAKAAAEKALNEAQARFDAATGPEALEKLVKERAEVLTKAQALAPEAKFDGMSLDEMRKTALENNGFTREELDGKDPAFVEGAFASLKAPESRQDAAGFGGVPLFVPEQRQDGQDTERTAKQAREEMLKRNRDAWQKTA